MSRADPADVSAGVGREARDLRDRVRQLTGAVGQVAAVGTAAQATAAGEVLVEARRAIYRILADEPRPGGADTSTDDESSH
jgi:hypothetical protein